MATASFATIDIGKTRRQMGQLVTRKGGSVEKVLIARAGLVTKKAISIAEKELHTDRPENRRRFPNRKHYVDSFHSSPVLNDPRGLRIMIENTHPMARLIERGSPAHTISTQKKSGLYFPAGKPWRVDGDPFTGKPRPLRHVNHPGTHGYRIMQKAVRSTGRIR